MLPLKLPRWQQFPGERLPVSIDDLCNLGSRSLFGEANVLSYPHLLFLQRGTCRAAQVNGSSEATDSALGLTSSWSSQEFQPQGCQTELLNRVKNSGVGMAKEY